MPIRGRHRCADRRLPLDKLGVTKGLDTLAVTKGLDTLAVTK